MSIKAGHGGNHKAGRGDDPHGVTGGGDRDFTPDGSYIPALTAEAWKREANGEFKDYRNGGNPALQRGGALMDAVRTKDWSKWSHGGALDPSKYDMEGWERPTSQ